MGAVSEEDGAARGPAVRVPPLGRGESAGSAGREGAGVETAPPPPPARSTKAAGRTQVARLLHDGGRARVDDGLVSIVVGSVG
jgi:hypothetical protein